MHGWIPCKKILEVTDLFGDDHYQYEFDNNWRIGNWDDASWLNGMDCWQKGIRVPDKTVVCGHFHSSWGHSKIHHDGIEFPETVHNLLNWKTTAFKDNGIVCLDACTAISHRVNCLKLFKQKNLSVQE